MTKLRRFPLALAICAVFGLGAWLGTALADRSATAPPIVYSGQILMSGAPVPDAAHMVQLALFRSLSGPTGNLCDNGVSSIPTVGGHFSLALNATCANVFETEESVYVDLTVDGTHLTTRTQAGAVPFAVTAEHSRDLRAPRRVATTGAAMSTGRITDASLVGFAAARAICGRTMSSSTAHLCYGSELARAQQEGIAIPGTGTYVPEFNWVDSGSGVYNYIVAGDCSAFTSATDICGTSTLCVRSVWGNGPSNCSVSTPLLCCD